MHPLTPERWQQLEVVLDTALELSPELRSRYLDIACAGDPALRQDAEGLISLDAPGSHPLPSHDSSEKSTNGQTKKAVDQLRSVDHKLAHAFELYHLGGLSLEHVANTLGVTTEAAALGLRKSRVLVRALLRS